MLVCVELRILRNYICGRRLSSMTRLQALVLNSGHDVLQRRQPIVDQSQMKNQQCEDGHEQGYV